MRLISAICRTHFFFFLSVCSTKSRENNCSLSHSPKPKVSGCPTATGQDSPLDSPAMSRWFKPEVEATSSIRSIQIEERAMKDLKRFYSSVKVVKNKS
ncbi:hypothetical protein PVK06_049209 [Gossypium arboreum]|uniref:Secreted protein n=1 Tax=Gossypium arboreum TaxID=29729 RepID=A0ABR0MJZ8_GOSAR|nr:hypothetical protein PVK06_049209 [Gossypium arboreum]